MYFSNLTKYNLEFIGLQIEPLEPLILGFDGNTPKEIDASGAVIFTLCTDIFINYSDPNNFIESKYQEFETENILQSYTHHLN